MRKVDRYMAITLQTTSKIMFETSHPRPSSGYGSDDIYLSYFGVLTNRDGTLSLDSDKFATYFAAYPDNFSALTQSRASADNSSITPTIVGDYFEPGTFSLGISSGVATITDSDGVATQMTDATTVYVAPSGNAAGLNIETTLTDATATFIWVCH